jgi:hypothetical protein
MKKPKFVSTFKQNDRENKIFDIIVLFIFCKVPYVQYFASFQLAANDLSTQHMCELFKYKFFLHALCI